MLKPPTEPRPEPADNERPIGELVHELIEDGKAYARAEVGVIVQAASVPRERAVEASQHANRVHPGPSCLRIGVARVSICSDPVREIRKYPRWWNTGAGKASTPFAASFATKSRSSYGGGVRT